MNIAELKGEKTVKTLAKRLLAEPYKKTKKTTNAEMEAALLRLNPQLNQIRELKEGTPIVVPGEFALAVRRVIYAVARFNGGFVATGPGCGVEITGCREGTRRELRRRSRSRANLVKERAGEGVCSPVARTERVFFQCCNRSENTGQRASSSLLSGGRAHWARSSRN
jgi:hypothetical protein